MLRPVLHTSTKSCAVRLPLLGDAREEAERFARRGTCCGAGQGWSWDGCGKSQVEANRGVILGGHLVDSQLPEGRVEAGDLAATVIQLSGFKKTSGA